MEDERFIEKTFPIKEVSEESAREKNIRHGHISTLHIWWARKPLASSRATSYAALIKALNDEGEIQKKKNFIVDLSKWENSLNMSLIEKARKDILEANNGVPPKVLDPFAGGGSIPLEALRLGCETYAGDYNPVAVLILKCILEYPQKYGKEGEIEREIEEFGRKEKRKVNVKNILVEDVRYWGEWVLEETKREIGRFYPKDKDGAIPVGYYWMRTVLCQNPSCMIEIPLIINWWLAKKDKRKISLYPYVEGKEVKFKIVGTGYEKMPDDFDPEEGTVSKANVRCPVCGTVIDDDTTRKLFQQGKSGQRMIAVVLTYPGREGKYYRLATEEDVRIYKEAEKYLNEKREKLMEEWGIDPVPDEPLPPKETLGFRVQRYGMLKWGDLFNSRQKLALITFTEKVRKAYEEMINRGYDREYAKAVVSYLGMGMDKLSTYLAVLVRWRGDVMSFERIFDKQALGMVWDYGEVNPFNDSRGSWDIDLILEMIKKISLNMQPSFVSQFSATSLPYPDNFFDAVFTDPPYYDNINYAELSDFFYVWLKRSIGDLYPELFTTPLVPKSQEIVANPIRHGGSEKAKKFFEENLKKSFQEIYRVLKPNGIAIIVYAHKSNSGWETLINSILDSGLVVTASWPIDTEMKTRLNAQETASLASSIYIVARKRKKEGVGFYNEVRTEIENYLGKKLDRLWAEGISGSDFFISAIGSAIEIFGKYEKVMDYEGNIIRANRLLEDVRKIVTEYAVKRILHNGFSAEISNLTRFYILYRWEFGEARVEFDEARKLAVGCGLDLEKEWNNKNGFIKKEKEFIRVLGPQDRKLEDLEDSFELIDVLHYVVRLWELGKRDAVVEKLNRRGFLKSDIFYSVAQAISETLPLGSKEKKLIDGFLPNKDRLIRSSGQIEMDI